MEQLVRWIEQVIAVAAGRARPGDASLVPAERLRLVNELLETQVKERTEMVRVLQDVTMIANEAITLEEGFRRVLERVARHNGWCFGHAYVPSRRKPNTLVRARAYFEEPPGRLAEFRRISRSVRLRVGEGLPGRVFELGEPQWLTDCTDELTERCPAIEAPLAIKSAMAFPIQVAGDVLAVFEFFSERDCRPNEHLTESMAAIGTQLGLFAMRKQMEWAMTELSTREQQRIGRDLHDQLGQQLTGVALLAKSLEREMRKESSPFAKRMADVARGLKDAQTQVRLLARGLSVVDVDAEGLMKALDDLARTSAARFQLDVRFIPKVRTLVRENEMAVELYRIAQEAVTNAAKHGTATRITIELTSNDDQIGLIIRDDGVGISDATRQRWGIGMSTMRYRANRLGGDLTVSRGPDRGTVVQCVVNNDNEPDSEDGDGDGTVQDPAGR